MTNQNLRWWIEAYLIYLLHKTTEIIQWKSLVVYMGILNARSLIPLTPNPPCYSQPGSPDWRSVAYFRKIVYFYNTEQCQSWPFLLFKYGHKCQLWLSPTRVLLNYPDSMLSTLPRPVAEQKTFQLVWLLLALKFNFKIVYP